MYCSKCGNQMEENEKFCSSCGATNEGQPQTSASGEKGEQIKALLQNKKLVLGAIGALIVIVLVVGGMMNKDNTNNSPMNVTKALFKAIDR